MRLIATKPLTYATRRLQAGDEFDAFNPYARTLLAIGFARMKEDAGKKITVVGLIDGLRADAAALGIDVDNRWGAKRLQAEIDNALRKN